jgi:hypothetical protein
MRFSFASTAAVVAVLALPQPARAADALGLEIAAKGGVKTNPFDNGADPVHPGFGARAGASISRIYFGLSLMYYLHADTQEAPPAGLGAGGVTAMVSSHDLFVGVESGYDFRLLDVITIRPQVGVGAWTDSSSCQISPPSSTLSCGGTSSTNAYLEPGIRRSCCSAATSSSAWTRTASCCR